MTTTVRADDLADPAGTGVHPVLHPDQPMADGAEPMTAFRNATCEAIRELVRRHAGEHVLAFGFTENVLAAAELVRHNDATHLPGIQRHSRFRAHAVLGS